MAKRKVYYFPIKRAARFGSKYLTDVNGGRIQYGRSIKVSYNKFSQLWSAANNHYSIAFITRDSAAKTIDDMYSIHALSNTGIESSEPQESTPRQTFDTLENALTHIMKNNGYILSVMQH